MKSCIFIVQISHTFEVAKEYNWSKKTSPTSIAKIKIGKATLIIRSYENHDIRNGFTLENANSIMNSSGAIVHAIYAEDMKLNGLMSHATIQQKDNRTCKKQ